MNTGAPTEGPSPTPGETSRPPPASVPPDSPPPRAETPRHIPVTHHTTFRMEPTLPFPFPPPCPGTESVTPGNRDPGPTVTSAPLTPTPRSTGSRKKETPPFTPVKHPKRDPKAHHLHGWDDTYIPKWLIDVPEGLRRKLVWTNSHSTVIPDNAIILLFVGEKDGGALDEILESRHPDLKDRIFAIDLKRCKRFHNFLSDEPYNSLCTAAAEGRLYMVGGGPMCRTFTVLRLLQLDSCIGMLCRGICHHDLTK